jgi:hypothetical protein
MKKEGGFAMKSFWVKVFSLLFAVLFFIPGVFAFTQGSSFTVVVNGNPFQGEVFLKNRTIYVELYPFLKVLNQMEYVFYTSDLMEDRIGRAFVSLQGAANSLGGNLQVNWKQSEASFNLNHQGNNFTQPHSNQLSPSPPQVSIFINDQPFYAPYLIVGHDVFVDLVPFAKALNVPYISFYFQDLLQAQNGRVFISLQGVASTMNATLKINWDTGNVDFLIPPSVAQAEQKAYALNTQPQQIYNNYYYSYPYPYWYSLYYPFYAGYFGFYNCGFWGFPCFYPYVGFGFFGFDGDYDWDDYCYVFGCGPIIVLNGNSNMQTPPQNSASKVNFIPGRILFPRPVSPRPSGMLPVLPQLPPNHTSVSRKPLPVEPIPLQKPRLLPPKPQPIPNPPHPTPQLIPNPTQTKPQPIPNMPRPAPPSFHPPNPSSPPVPPVNRVFRGGGGFPSGGFRGGNFQVSPRKGR